VVRSSIPEKPDAIDVPAAGRQGNGLPLSWPIFGVMILNRNGRRWLAALYESLRRQKYPALRIYLIDNASNDDSVALTLARYPEVKILRFSENIGYCMAYNRAMTHAFGDGCEWVVWANNDLLLEPGCLRELARAATQSRHIGVAGPAFYAWDSDEPNDYMRGNHPGAIEPMQEGSVVPIDVAWVEGSFLAVSAACVRDVGWLDPYLFFYWEEADFCRRARRKGWRVVLAPRAIARHYGGGSVTNPANANWANFLKSRNQYVYALAAPHRSFAMNLLLGLHMFLVLAKAALKQSPTAFVYEVRALWRLLFELRTIKAKWRRDRTGGFPPPVSDQYAQVILEIVN
jgi:GT2 family glycosyltransferase